MIVVDRSRCVGAGQCVVQAEHLFAQDETEGLVIVLEAEPGADDQPAAEMAAIACPSRAIQLIYS
jgi:ferredoxin